MLAAVALAVARNGPQFFAAFLIAFGFWDLFFYVFLKVLIDWPASLFTWDLLFLLPVPWTGPVIAPVLVAASMIASGGVVWFRESAGRPLRLTWAEWAAVVAGGLIVVVSFCWDFRNIMAGGDPNAFLWPMFAIGEGIGLTGFLRPSGVIAAPGAGGMRPVSNRIETNRELAHPRHPV